MSGFKARVELAEAVGADLDAAAVLSLYTFDPLGSDQNFRELTIDVSRWGEPGNLNGQFVVQPETVPSNVFRFGSMGRNSLRGPGFQKADLALFKDFRLTERFTLQFKAEAFNFTNTPRFGNPAANVSSMTVNATTGAVTNANNFMAITSASEERKFRFGLRLSF